MQGHIPCILMLMLMGRLIVLIHNSCRLLALNTFSKEKEHMLDCPVHFHAYDTSFSMAGNYHDVQASLKYIGENCLFSICANYNLNVVGKNCAEA